MNWGKPREELLRDINRTIIELKKLLPDAPLPHLVGGAICGVVERRVNEKRWLPITGANEMSKMRNYVENQYPGATRLWEWIRLTEFLRSIPHVPHKAQPLTKSDISCILALTRSPREAAVFWLALLTCSRVGNLAGLDVREVDPMDVTITNTAHKTYKHVGTRTLRLMYWNEKMQKAITDGLPIGKITDADEERMKEILRKLKLQQHSVRRTGVQVYLGARVPEDRIRAITLHTDSRMLLSYADLFEPVLDIRKSTGLANSLAPFIVMTQRENHAPTF